MRVGQGGLNAQGRTDTRLPPDRSGPSSPEPRRDGPARRRIRDRVRLAFRSDAIASVCLPSSDWISPKSYQASHPRVRIAWRAAERRGPAVAGRTPGTRKLSGATRPTSRDCAQPPADIRPTAFGELVGAAVGVAHLEIKHRAGGLVLRDQRLPIAGCRLRDWFSQRPGPPRYKDRPHPNRRRRKARLHRNSRTLLRRLLETRPAGSPPDGAGSGGRSSPRARRLRCGAWAYGSRCNSRLADGRLPG